MTRTTIRTLALGTLLLTLAAPALGGNPYGAQLCTANDQLFWYIQVSDTHIGASGSDDSNNLRWLATEARSVVQPAFTVVSGDLTDSTNGNWLGLPNGPYQAEWDEYNSILAGSGVDAGNYYDLPGNHDEYNDGTLAYYRANSVQGRATGSTQVSWSRDYPFGSYHFIGVNTAANDGAGFSLFFPFGDHAGLDNGELTFVHDALEQHTGADLTLLFGHHPLEDTGYSDDTWVFYGAAAFAGLLDSYGASDYGYGHTHRASTAFFTGGEEYDTGTVYAIDPGVFYVNVSSLGKASDGNFSVAAVDCNGLSIVTQAMRSWPVVLITAPMDRNLGRSAQPYGYTVPAAPNPLRALVFDSAAVTAVDYRIDGAGDWLPMTAVPANPKLWEATWDGSALAEGDHTLEVRATGTTTRSDLITVRVEGGVTPPVFVDQLATGEIPGSGTVSGSYSDTWALDGAVETLTERLSGGKPASRTSLLEHTWTFTVQPGANVTLFADASADAGEGFVFAWSTDNASFTDLFTVTGAMGAYSATLPNTLSGTLYLRVRDTDRTPGNTSLESLRVDRLLVRTQLQSGGDLPAVPAGLAATALSDSAIALAWNDVADEWGYRIERLDGAWQEIASVAADTTSYTDGGLQAATTYAYRVSAYNGAGSSGYSEEASATTAAGPPISLTASTYKVKLDGFVELAWSGATSANVTIERNGVSIATVPDTGGYTDALGKKPSGTFIYRVCEAGTAVCSNEAAVSF